MRPKSLVLLALALGCGLIASIGISQVLDSKGKPVAVATVPIYVALQNVNLGDPIDETLVKLEEWPKDKVPAGAIASWEELEDRRPRTTIFAGAPVLDSQLLAKGQINDTMTAIPADMRVKTVAVDARKSAAGLILPGNRVDLQLFVSRNERQGIYSPFTKVFMQSVRVFAVDQKVERAANGEESRTVAKTVSLLVTPEQASKITLAENLGEVSLIPRNADDESVISDVEVTFEDILGRSTINRRDDERGKSENDNQAALKAAASSITNSNTKPAFSMTIIYPDDVSKYEFVNGEPVHGDRDGSAVGISSAADSPIEDGAAGVENAPPADFPIDLKTK